MIIADVWPPATNIMPIAQMVHPPPVAILSKISLAHMEFPLVLIIALILPCRIPSNTLWAPFKKYGALSTDLKVQRCTKFMRAQFLGTLITITVIFIG